MIKHHFNVQAERLADFTNKQLNIKIALLLFFASLISIALFIAFDDVVAGEVKQQYAQQLQQTSGEEVDMSILLNTLMLTFAMLTALLLGLLTLAAGFIGANSYFAFRSYFQRSITLWRLTQESMYIYLKALYATMLFVAALLCSLQR